VIALDDPESMIHCAHALIRMGGATAPGVAAFSPSGGTIALTADRLAAAGLPLADLAQATRDALHGIIPPARPLNPLDIGGLARGEALSTAIEVQAVLSADPQVGVVLVVVATTPELEQKVTKWAEAALRTRKPTVILLTPGSLLDDVRRKLRALRCPYTDRMDDALRVVRAMIEYGRVAAGATRETTPIPKPDVPLPELAEGRLSESEAKALLGRIGIDSPAEIASRSVEQAIAAAEQLGYPVVLKAVARELVHKSDAGGVRLGLRNADEVRDAWTQIEERLERERPDCALEAMSVQAMIRGGLEIVAGVRRDEQFGAVLMVGAGGIFVELVRDVAFALAPLGREEARELVAGLKLWPLLTGARGAVPLDVEALVDTLVRLSALAETLGPRLLEIEINPLLVRSSGAIALDARATIAPARRAT
jgi:acetyl-CoA synthetase (ADP-forming)